jgi:hypothetical protein
MRAMFVDFAGVIAALDRFALAGAWLDVADTDGPLRVYGQAATPSWSGDGLLLIEVGWAGLAVADLSLAPAQFELAMVTDGALVVLEQHRSVLVGPVEDGNRNHWAVPALRSDLLVFGGGDVLERLAR